MITVEDCAAFCDADSRWVEHLERRESLNRITAYAQAHAQLAHGTGQSAMPGKTHRPAPLEQQST